MMRMSAWLQAKLICQWKLCPYQLVIATPRHLHTMAMFSSGAHFGSVNSLAQYFCCMCAIMLVDCVLKFWCCQWAPLEFSLLVYCTLVFLDPLFPTLVPQHSWVPWAFYMVPSLDIWNKNLEVTVVSLVHSPFLLASPMGQYCFAGWHLSSLSVKLPSGRPATGRVAGGRAAYAARQASTVASH